MKSRQPNAVGKFRDAIYVTTRRAKRIKGAAGA
jgi:hypothetical protein